MSNILCCVTAVVIVVLFLLAMSILFGRPHDECHQWAEGEYRTIACEMHED